MRATINLDHELLEESERITGRKGSTDLICEDLRTLSERENAGQLLRLGSSEVQLRPVPQCRPTNASMC
ncbi:MAG: type II toxin-antitoxin system VapB family antitoxin [Actinomycetota bacterium]|jgi:hypothetical protein|nr:type II toxin-antitoxin system VapB family antitoxin [Actinomycetota bacterium]